MCLCEASSTTQAAIRGFFSHRGPESARSSAASTRRNSSPADFAPRMPAWLAQPGRHRAVEPPSDEKCLLFWDPVREISAVVDHADMVAQALLPVLSNLPCNKTAQTRVSVPQDRLAFPPLASNLQLLTSSKVEGQGFSPDTTLARSSTLVAALCSLAACLPRPRIALWPTVIPPGASIAMPLTAPPDTHHLS